MSRILRVILSLAVVLLTLIIGGVLWLNIRLKPDAQGRVVPLGESIDIRTLSQFRAALEKRESFVIYEGMPHQNLERDLLKAEIKSKNTTKLHGFHFYSEEIYPSDTEEETLVAAILDEGAFIEWRGEKRCFGFHPDYAVQWEASQGKSYIALFCFNCSEVKFYGNGFRLYADLASEKFFENFLDRYQDRRPEK